MATFYATKITKSAMHSKQQQQQRESNEEKAKCLLNRHLSVLDTAVQSTISQGEHKTTANIHELVKNIEKYLCVCIGVSIKNTMYNYF